MKSFLASLLVSLLFIQSTLSQEWETLNAPYEDLDPLPEQLKYLGADYVLQKGRFESTKTPLPEKAYDLVKVEKVERSTNSDVTYYRYTVIFEESHDVDGFKGDSAVEATYTVSYRESNGDFVVTDYKYTLDPYGREPEEEDGSEDIDSNVGYDETLIDARLLRNGTSNFSSLYENGKEDAIANGIEKGDLPDAEYKVDYIYAANTMEIRQGEPEKYLSVDVKLVDSEGNYFLATFSINYDPVEEEDIVPTGSPKAYIKLPIEVFFGDIGTGEAGETEAEVGEVGENEAEVGEFEDFGETEGADEIEEFEEYEEIEAVEGTVSII